MEQRWLTWANLLTTTRLVLLAPLTYSISHALWAWAAVIFTVAVLTDVLDGKIARHLHQTSPIGGLFDHATDAMFVTLGCWSFASLGLLNEWLPWLIPAAFIQYMLDSRVLSGIALRMNAIGRSNGVAYYVLLGAAIGSELLDWPWLHAPLRWLGWLMVVTTLASMLDRLITLLGTDHNR